MLRHSHALCSAPSWQVPRMMLRLAVRADELNLASAEVHSALQPVIDSGSIVLKDARGGAERIQRISRDLQTFSRGEDGEHAGPVVLVVST